MDGAEVHRDRLLALHDQLAQHDGYLVVDEAFADAAPACSVASLAGSKRYPRLLVLRSFGKFYGLAGLRLGFVLGAADDIAALDAMVGPWPISGPAIEIGGKALLDRNWVDATRVRLEEDSLRLDGIVKRAGWTLVGGTPLFRLYNVGNAAAMQERLARARIWSRIFREKPNWLRLGLPGDETEWARLSEALSTR